MKKPDKHFHPGMHLTDNTRELIARAIQDARSTMVNAQLGTQEELMLYADAALSAIRAESKAGELESPTQS